MWNKNFRRAIQSLNMIFYDTFFHWRSLWYITNLSFSNEFHKQIGRNPVSEPTIYCLSWIPNTCLICAALTYCILDIYFHCCEHLSHRCKLLTSSALAQCLNFCLNFKVDRYIWLSIFGIIWLTGKTFQLTALAWQHR